MKKEHNLARLFLISSAAILILAPSYFETFEKFELATLDLRFNMRPAQRQNQDIAIIEIANDTLEKIGTWPLKRNLHAAVIDILSSLGARSIVMDILLSEPTPDDGELVRATEKSGRVFYEVSLDIPTMARPRRPGGLIEADKIDTALLPDLAGRARGCGFTNVIPDIDGKTRRAPLKIRLKDKIYPHLALAVAADYLGKGFNEIQPPVDSDSFLVINYAGKWKETFRHYSYVDILRSYALFEHGEAGDVDLNELKGKVCFIGLTATGTHDFNPVPLEERYPGLGVHANIFNTIVTGNFIKQAGRPGNLLILLLFSLIVALAALRTRPLVSSLVMFSAVTALFNLSVALFVFMNIWIDMFYPMMALFVIYLSITFYRFVSERHKTLLIGKELEVARRIQQSLLPALPEGLKDIAIACDMAPAKQVGGDLYDFIRVGENKTGIMIGDVSGKGVPAALYMARVVSLFRLLSKMHEGTSGAVAALNAALAEEPAANLFVTLSYVIYDSASRTLTFSSGGHPPMLLVKKDDKKCRLLGVREGLPLGLMEGGFSEERAEGLTKGDLLVLYTDGVTEAMNSRGDEFGQDALIKVVEENSSSDTTGLLSAIKEALFKFSRSAPQHDDITIIVIKIK